MNNNIIHVEILPYLDGPFQEKVKWFADWHHAPVFIVREEKNKVGNTVVSIDVSPNPIWAFALGELYGKMMIELLNHKA